MINNSKLSENETEVMAFTWQDCFWKNLWFVFFDGTVQEEIHCTSEENPTILCKDVIQIYTNKMHYSSYSRIQPMHIMR